MLFLVCLPPTNDLEFCSPPQRHYIVACLDVIIADVPPLTKVASGRFGYNKS